MAAVEQNDSPESESQAAVTQNLFRHHIVGTVAGVGVGNRSNPGEGAKGNKNQTNDNAKL